MPGSYHDEEEFKSSFNGKTVLRMLSSLKGYWPRVLAFLLLIAAVAVGDSLFTYTNKRLIDEVIVTRDLSRLPAVALVFGLLIACQAVGVFGFIFFAGF